jgi:hypothetical protein
MSSCLSCLDGQGTPGTGVLTKTMLKVDPVHVTLQGRKRADRYCVYTGTSQADRDLGNQVKQGSGGNSFRDYLLRVKGQVANC